MQNELSTLPAVHRLLARTELARAAERLGRDEARAAVRDVLATARERVRSGAQVPAEDTLVDEVLAVLARRSAPAFPEVLNASGVLIHTNLGRAPRLAAALPAYLALEYDLDAGGRGERLAPVTGRIGRYFACEAATVVTNNAAALVLLLAAHATGREVIVSRGELIEIGGSFRLPEIMAAAGVRLVEVGCTNRTRVADYERAIGEATAGVLIVHRSNFHLEGFVSTPDPSEVVALAHRRGIAAWIDQGSGCHLDLARYGLRHEPTVRELLATGADAVLFSGDKLLGAAQAGIITGRAAALGPLARHPLRRALRPDKSVLVALAATLDAYLAGLPEEVPLYRLLAEPEEHLRARARRLAGRLRDAGAEAIRARAVLGGGTTPDQTLSSWAVALPASAALEARLRAGRPAVVGRVEDDRLLLDLRAVFPAQDAILLAAVRAALPA